MADLHKHMMLNVALRNPPREPAHLEDWLDRVVTKVRMKKMWEPRAGWDDTPNNEGITGLVVLTTSHCSIHVWNNANPPYAKLDLYSCAEFEPEEFVEMVREFEPYWIDYLVVDRTATGFKEVARKQEQVIPVESLLTPEHQDILYSYHGEVEHRSLYREALGEHNRLYDLYGLPARQN